MKIVVTGHQGFIGGYLTQELIKRDHNFYGMDIKSGINILDKDVPPCDVIIHLAAQTSVLASMENPIADAINNIIGTIKILKENPKAKIIIASSAATKDPQSAYGVGKLAIEHYAHVLHKNAVVLRFPNVFAKDDHGVMTRFINEPKITVYGDGSQTRDMVHVSDIVKGIVRAIKWPAGAYEMGSGKSYTILELAKATGKEITFESKRDGDIEKSVCENTTPDWGPEVDPVGFIKLNVVRS